MSFMMLQYNKCALSLFGVSNLVGDIYKILKNNYTLVK